MRSIMHCYRSTGSIDASEHWIRTPPPAHQCESWTWILAAPERGQLLHVFSSFSDTTSASLVAITLVDYNVGPMHGFALLLINHHRCVIQIPSCGAIAVTLTVQSSHLHRTEQHRKRAQRWHSHGTITCYDCDACNGVTMYTLRNRKILSSPARWFLRWPRRYRCESILHIFATNPVSSPRPEKLCDFPCWVPSPRCNHWDGDYSLPCAALPEYQL